MKKYFWEKIAKTSQTLSYPGDILKLGLSSVFQENIFSQLGNSNSSKFFFKKMGQPLFRLFSVFSSKPYNFKKPINMKNVISIQYTAPGFEPTISQT